MISIIIVIFRDVLRDFFLSLFLILLFSFFYSSQNINWFIYSLTEFKKIIFLGNKNLLLFSLRCFLIKNCWEALFVWCSMNRSESLSVWWSWRYFQHTWDTCSCIIRWINSTTIPSCILKFSSIGAIAATISLTFNSQAV